VYAVALRETGAVDRALDVLEAANAARPGQRELLVVLATLSNEAGRAKDALRYAQELVAAYPDDEHAQALLAQIGSSSARSGEGGE
jgi:predicted Zn-dependent protease